MSDQPSRDGGESVLKRAERYRQLAAGLEQPSAQLFDDLDALHRPLQQLADAPLEDLQTWRAALANAAAALRGTGLSDTVASMLALRWAEEIARYDPASAAALEWVARVIVGAVAQNDAAVSVALQQVAAEPLLTGANINMHVRSISNFLLGEHMKRIGPVCRRHVEPLREELGGYIEGVPHHLKQWGVNVGERTRWALDVLGCLNDGAIGDWRLKDPRNSETAESRDDTAHSLREPFSPGASTAECDRPAGRELSESVVDRLAGELRRLALSGTGSITWAELGDLLRPHQPTAATRAYTLALEGRRLLAPVPRERSDAGQRRAFFELLSDGVFRWRILPAVLALPPAENTQPTSRDATTRTEPLVAPADQQGEGGSPATAPVGATGEVEPPVEPSRQKLPQMQTNARVADWFRRHPGVDPADIKRDRIAAEIGASGGAVSKSPMWIAFSEKKRTGTTPAERTVPLTDDMLATVPGEADMPDELAALIEDQQAEQAEEERRHGPS